MDLSPHLSLAEYLATAHRALVGEQARAWRADPLLWVHANRLAAEVFEPARLVVGTPLHCTSGYRCSPLNQAVRGRPTSKHVLALAIDVVPVGRDLRDAWQALVVALKAGRLPAVDEAILECNEWIHLQAAAEGKPRQALLGTRTDGAGSIFYVPWT